MTPITKMKKFLLSVIPALLLLVASAFAACPCITNVRLYPPQHAAGDAWWLLNEYAWYTPAGGTVTAVNPGTSSAYYQIAATISNADCNYDLLWSTTTWFNFQTQEPCSSNQTLVGVLKWDRWWDNCLGFYTDISIPIYMPAGADSINVAIVQTPSWCNTCPCSQAALSVCVKVVHTCTPNGG